MTTDALELPLMHWIWLTALTGIVSNIAWELFTYFGHATMHSLASAWHEFKKLPSHLFSLHAPLRIAGVVLGALAVVSLMQATSGFEFVAAPMQLVEAYRAFAHGVGDVLFAAILNADTRAMAYDVIVVAFVAIFVVWRTVMGWRHYAEFQAAHDGEGVALGTYFSLHLLGGLGALVVALAILAQIR